MHIAILDGIEQCCGELLRAEGHTTAEYQKCAPEQWSKIIADADALIVRSATTVTREMIVAAPRLKIIGRAGAGTDTIDVTAATERGILVMNTPGGNTIATAEHTMALLMSLMRNIPAAHLSMRNGEWERKKYVGSELFGKTIGIIGLGRVGMEVALRCKAFSMNIVGYDSLMSAEIAGKSGITIVPLNEIFRVSDIITMHTPLTDDTRGLLNERTIALCKNGVRIINCARGGIVDERALLEALESGKVAGVALDVYSEEPPKGSLLTAHPRCICTPHLGASTEEAQEKVAIQIARQIGDAFNGVRVAGAVNGDLIELTYKKGLAPFVQLAEKMGAIAAQMAPSSLTKIMVTIGGEAISDASSLLSAATAKGYLASHLLERVNFVNVRHLARQRGIHVSQMVEDDTQMYTALITAEFVFASGESISLGGTVVGSSIPRVVMVNGLQLEFSPEGTLLMYRNIDMPGMLAKVGAVLAENGINIANVVLGREEDKKEALTIMKIDSTIDTGVLAVLRGLDGVEDVRVLEF